MDFMNNFKPINLHINKWSAKNWANIINNYTQYVLFFRTCSKRKVAHVNEKIKLAD